MWTHHSQSFANARVAVAEIPLSGGIRDVAREAGVSTSTVSRVLNDKNGTVSISADTIERVKRAARQLNYRPNAWARSLRTAQTRCVGAIVFDLSHPFACELLHVINAACRARGYHLLLGTAEHDSNEGWALSDILRADRVDGVLMIGDTLTRNMEQEKTFAKAMERLVRLHKHVVTVGSRPSVAGEWSVTVGHGAGMAMAMDYLYELGHRQIAYVLDGFHPHSWEDRLRRQAYRGFLALHDLPDKPGLEVTVGGRDLQSVRKTLMPLFALPKPPSAVLVNNCVTAITVLKAMSSEGLKVPGDLSLIGFDDISFSSLCTPSLTAVRQPIEDMGSHAANALLDAIDTATPACGDQRERTVIFPPSLVLRESCAPPSNGG